MQTSVPGLVDLKDEPQHVLDMYGDDALKKGTFAQLPNRPPPFRTRSSFRTALPSRMGSAQQLTQTDTRTMPKRGSTGKYLVKDLKQRGLLKDTVVICGGVRQNHLFSGQTDQGQPQ